MTTLSPQELARWLATASDCTRPLLERQMAANCIVAAFTNQAATIETLRKALDLEKRTQLRVVRDGDRA